MRYGSDTPHVESERRAGRATRRPPKKPSPGRKLSDAKREERERRQHQARFKRLLVVAAVLGGVALVVWGAFALYRAPVFTVRDLVVTGADHYTKDQVVRIARIPAGVTLVRLPAADIKRRLEADPWIASAEVDRDYPSTVRIAIAERTPAAVVDAGGDRLWLVSTDGRWLGPRTEGTKLLPVIEDVPKLAPRAGAAVREVEVANAVKVLAGLSPKLRKRIVTVSAPTVEETALKTRGGVEIFVGTATEMAVKDKIIGEILAEHDGVVYINVRVTDRPTWRGLEQE